MTLPEVMRAVLTEPMTQAELAVTDAQAGFDSTMDNRMLRNVVGEELRLGGFRKEGAKWTGGCRPGVSQAYWQPHGVTLDVVANSGHPGTS